MANANFVEARRIASEAISRKFMDRVESSSKNKEVSSRVVEAISNYIRNNVSEKILERIDEMTDFKADFSVGKEGINNIPLERRSLFVRSLILTGLSGMSISTGLMESLYEEFKSDIEAKTLTLNDICKASKEIGLDFNVVTDNCDDKQAVDEVKNQLRVYFESILESNEMKPIVKDVNYVNYINEFSDKSIDENIVDLKEVFKKLNTDEIIGLSYTSAIKSHDVIEYITTCLLDGCLKAKTA